MSLIRCADSSRPSATRSSSATPYLRPSGRASPEPSRSAAPASSCSGRASRRAWNMARPTATPTASSASEPVTASASVTPSVATESSATTMTRKSLVTARAMMLSSALGGDPNVTGGPPSRLMATYLSGSERAAAAASVGSGVRPERSRFSSVLATVVASRCTSWWAASDCSRISTNASGRPNSTTAVTATASVENSSRRRTSACRRPDHGLITPLEPEPNAAHGGDVAGAVRVVAQLAAEPGDVHVERLGRAPPLAVPDLAHDLFPGDHLPGVVHQHTQQVELLGGELELVFADPGAPGIRVHPHTLHGAGLRAAPAEQGADPGQQLGQPERLGHVVVGARVEPDHRVHLVRPRGEDEHGDGLPFRAQTPAYLQPVQLGQPDVEHDQVEPAGHGRIQRARAVSRNVDVIAFAPQRAGQWVGDGEVILGKQNAGHDPMVRRLSANPDADAELKYGRSGQKRCRRGTQTGVTPWRRRENRRSLPAAAANRLTSSARNSPGSTTSSATSSDASRRTSMSLS